MNRFLLKSKKLSYSGLPLAYLLLCSSSLHLPLVSVDGAVIRHQWTSVVLLKLQIIKKLAQRISL